MGPWRLLKILTNENSVREPRHRRPEPHLVMAAPDQVAAYTEGGGPTGTLLPLYRLHIERLTTLVSPGDTILDLGCGSGQLLALMAKSFPRCHFVGVDLSTTMLDTAKQICSAAAVQNVEFVHDDLVSLSRIGQRQFDVVSSCLAFHHLPDSASLLTAFFTLDRVLKVGGGVLVSDLGPLRSERTIDLLVDDQRSQQSPLLVEDYEHSLRAAFTMDDWSRAIQNVRKVSLKVDWTSPIHFLVQIHSPRTTSEQPRYQAGNLPDLALKHRFEYFLLSRMMKPRPEEPV